MQETEGDNINPYPQIISVAQARDGYGNAGLLTVMMLYAVAEGVNQTGLLEKVQLPSLLPFLPCPLLPKAHPPRSRY